MWVLRLLLSTCVSVWASREIEYDVSAKTQGNNGSSQICLWRKCGSVLLCLRSVMIAMVFWRMSPEAIYLGLDLGLSSLKTGFCSDGSLLMYLDHHNNLCLTHNLLWSNVHSEFWIKLSIITLTDHVPDPSMLKHHYSDIRWKKWTLMSHILPNFKVPDWWWIIFRLPNDWKKSNTSTYILKVSQCICMLIYLSDLIRMQIWFFLALNFNTYLVLQGFNLNRNSIPSTSYWCWSVRPACCWEVLVVRGELISNQAGSFVV